MKFFLSILCLGLMACNPSEKRHTAPEKTHEEKTQQEKVLHQPLTDHEHVEIYTFIGRFLEEDVGKISEKEMQQKLVTEQKYEGDQNYKPHIASMYEGEVAGLLRILLLKDARYEDITLYGKDGVGCATSGIRSRDLLFQNRPHDLNLGFLTPEILSGPRVYHYTHNNMVYDEHICPLFKDNGIYTLQKSEKSVLIGYLSYIVQSPPLKS